MKIILRVLLVTVPIALFICVVAQMVIANETMVLGNKLKLVDKRITELKEQNDVLNRRVSELSSISRISTLAEKQGFVGAKNFIAFDTEQYPVAFKR